MYMAPNKRLFEKERERERIRQMKRGVHWRPHIRTMLNQTSLLFEQNLPGTD